MELIAEYFEVAAARQSNYSDSPLDMRSHAEVGVDEYTEVTHWCIDGMMASVPILNADRKRATLVSIWSVHARSQPCVLWEAHEEAEW